MPDGRVVLIKRDIDPGRGKWSFPAGYVELGETVRDAAARETLEEVKTRVRIVRQVGVYSYPDAGTVTITYLGRVRRGEKPAAGHECSDVMIVRPTEIPWKQLAFRSTVDALKDWKRKMK